ncbi:peptidase dimerization domain-containing protein [Dactylosporangium cerinum]
MQFRRGDRLADVAGAHRGHRGRRGRRADPGGQRRGRLKIARKGIAHYSLRVTGRASHAGVAPHLGINAGIELAHQVLRIAALGAPPDTTVTPTDSSAGTTSNTVPAGARLSVDARAFDPAELARVDAALRGLRPVLPGAELLVELGPSRPAMPASASAAMFALAQRVGLELGLPPLVGEAVGGGSDGNLTAGIGVPTLDGLGVIGGNAHAEGSGPTWPACRTGPRSSPGWWTRSAASRELPGGGRVGVRPGGGGAGRGRGDRGRRRRGRGRVRGHVAAAATGVAGRPPGRDRGTGAAADVCALGQLRRRGAAGRPAGRGGRRLLRPGRDRHPAPALVRRRGRARRPRPGRRVRAETAPAGLDPGPGRAGGALDLRPARPAQRVLQPGQARRAGGALPAGVLRRDGRRHQQRRPQRPAAARVAAGLPEAVAAAHGDQVVVDLAGTPKLLDRTTDGAPVAGPGGAGAAAVPTPRLLVAVPTDVEDLRRRDPAAATAWRLAVRAAMVGRLAAGWRVAGVSRDGFYVLEEA